MREKMIMEHVRIEGRRGSGTEFQGTLISAVTTYGPERARWFEMKLWEHENGGWVVDRVSMSVLYHASNTTCRRQDDRLMGTPTKVSELPELAEPCGACNPEWPEKMSGDTLVRFEAPRHTVIHCPTARDVIEAVTVDRTRPGSKPFASGPATELLTEAALKNPLIADALRESGAVTSVKTE
jgi:hypothetical protein